MKKLLSIFSVLAVAALLFASCSATKSVAYGGSTRSKFVGTWTCNNVTYEGIVQGSVQSLFDQSRPDDFMGSVWKLTNSGNGIYTLNNGVSQSIFWSVNTAGGNQLFQFKKVYQGDKPKNVAEGYQLVISGADNSGFTVKVPVNFGNSTGYVVLTFSKS